MIKSCYLLVTVFWCAWNTLTLYPSPLVSINTTISITKECNDLFNIRAVLRPNNDKKYSAFSYLIGGKDSNLRVE